MRVWPAAAGGYRAGMNPTVRMLLLVASIVLLVLVGMAGMGWLIEGHKDPVVALQGFGLAAFVAAHL